MTLEERILSVLRYDRETGFFFWLPGADVGGSGSWQRVPGARAGHVSGRYRYISLDRVSYLEHRLAWFFVTGQWPPHEIDHENGVSTENRWANLREATHGQNMQNVLRFPKNTSGFPGVSFHKARGKWRATLSLNNRSIHIGHFDTPESAYAAYLARKADLHPYSTLARSLSK